MRFEEMQEIWRAQLSTGAQEVAIDELLDRVQRRSCYLRWSATAEEFGMVAICLFVGVQQAWEPLTRGTDPHQLVGSILMLGVALYVLWGRVRRRRVEAGMPPGVHGELLRSIYRIDYHIARSRTFLWWFLLPSALIVTLSFWRAEEAIPVWKWFAVLGSFPLALAVVQLGVRLGQLPVKRDLEELRNELARGTQPADGRESE